MIEDSVVIANAVALLVMSTLSHAVIEGLWVSTNLCILKAGDGGCDEPHRPCHHICWWKSGGCDR